MFNDLLDILEGVFPTKNDFAKIFNKILYSPKCYWKFYIQYFIGSLLLWWCGKNKTGEEKIKLIFFLFFFWTKRETARSLHIASKGDLLFGVQVFTSMRKDKMQLYSIILVLGKYFPLVTFILSLKRSGSRLFW